ncbi:MAG: hypothetical protein D6729_09690, partial [Deltaproteobacteria bacterium]
TREKVPLAEGPAPFAALDGLDAALVVRARLERDLPFLVDFTPGEALPHLCPACAPKAVEAFARRLGRALDGQVAVLVLGFDLQQVQQEPVRPRDLFFFARHVFVARTREAKEAAALARDLAQLVRSAGWPVEAVRSPRPGAHFAVVLPQEGTRPARTVVFGAGGDRLYFGSSQRAAEAALAVSERAGGPAFSLRIEPRIFARDLIDDGGSAFPDRFDLRGAFSGVVIRLGESLRRTPPILVRAQPVGDHIEVQARLSLPPPEGEKVLGAGEVPPE